MNNLNIEESLNNFNIEKILLKYYYTKEKLEKGIDIPQKGGKLQITYYHKLFCLQEKDKIKDNAFAEHYAFDMTDSNSLEFEFIKTLEHFNDLQEKLLVDEFDKTQSDAKWNKYIIIIVSPNDFKKFSNQFNKLQNDRTLATKFVLSSERADKFFDMQNTLKKVTEGIKINSISINNFNSFTSQKKLEFKKINLFSGVNGAGKSTAIDAIVDAMTKKTVSDERTVKLLLENEQDGFTHSTMTRKEIEIHWYGKKAHSDDEKDLGKDYLNEKFFAHNYCSMEATSMHTREDGLDKYWGNYSSLATEFFRLTNEYLPELLFLIKQLDDKVQAENLLSEKEIKQLFEQIYNGFTGIMKQKNRGYKEWEKSKTLPDKIFKIHDADKDYKLEWLKDNKDTLDDVFCLLTGNRDYLEIGRDDGQKEGLKRGSNNLAIQFEKMSAGQRVCCVFSYMLTNFLKTENAPNFIILDEPIVYLDATFTSNLIDALRLLAVNGTQIFFTTHNRHTAMLFRRKFSFFENEFREFEFDQDDNGGVEIKWYEYSPTENVPIDKGFLCF